MIAVATKFEVEEGRVVVIVEEDNKVEEDKAVVVVAAAAVAARDVTVVGTVVVIVVVVAVGARMARGFLFNTTAIPKRPTKVERTRHGVDRSMMYQSTGLARASVSET